MSRPYGVDNLTATQMRTLVAVHESRSIRRAATRLKIRSGAVSQAVTRIELEIGTRVFARTRGAFGSALPTPAGRAIVAEAYVILEALERIKRYAAS